MEAFWVSTGLVAVAEIGDKTQLLSFVLAARYKRPWLIAWGVLLATLLNHGLAGSLGAWVTQQVSPQALRWVLGLSFLAMAAWALVPDQLSADEAAPRGRWGGAVFLTSFVSFFLAEMGDKTQIATVGLAAHYAAPVAVVLGTTLGMMLANAPALWLGDRLSLRLAASGAFQWVRWAAALLFAVLGLWILLTGA